MLFKIMYRGFGKDMFNFEKALKEKKIKIKYTGSAYDYVFKLEEAYLGWLLVEANFQKYLKEIGRIKNESNN